MKKNLTIDDFFIKQVVEWDNLERTFGKREYKKFYKWMTGQGCYPEGVFPWDLERYLKYKYNKNDNKRT